MAKRSPSEAAERRVIGLTGGIGVGKSTVATRLGALGATVVDCDDLGRQVVEPGGGAYDELVAHFGPVVLRDDGHLDRARMAELVFADPEALEQLNAITHPAIDIEIAAAIDAAPPGPVVLDMAVLVETELGAGQYSQVLIIEAPLEQRLARLRRSRGMSDEQSRARIANQADDDQRRAVADHVIVNDGSQAELRAATDAFWREAGLG
jgi:dephospho-CoA kinase